MTGRAPTHAAGETFGLLTVVARDHNRGNAAYWLCRCACGATTATRGDRLRSGYTKSCGCLTKTASYHGGVRPRHGHAVGGRPSRTWNTWASMRRRCTDPREANWKYYGALGVTVCAEWMTSFEAFLRDIGERPADKTLDRIDPYGNYEPSNCRWATPSEQRRNQRRRVPALHP